MVEITFFDSWDEAMEAERKARERADRYVQPWHREVRAGEVLLSDPGYGFPIFHEVLDMEKIVGENFKMYGEDYEDEGIWTLDIYKEPHMKNYRFCRSYSEVVPEGELGDIHLSVAIGKVPRNVFEELRENKFRYIAQDL